MVHLPVRRPDPYDSFFPFAFGSLFAPFRDFCPDTIINIHLALLGLAPPSPPHVVGPSLLTRTSFEQGLSNKLHNSIVINNKSQTKQCIKQTRDALPSSSPATLVVAINKKAAQPLAPSHSCTPSLPTPNSCPSNVVSGSKEKKHILDEYVSKFCSDNQESIITKKKVSLIIMNLCSLWHPLTNARSHPPASTTKYRS
jgi:hypothetical protein